jgi:hypothetical protein
MKRLIGVLIVLVISAAVAKSHYDGVCMEQHYAGAAVTVQGVYCWRRFNDTFDDFAPLDKIIEKARMLEKLERCMEANPDRQWMCDPRYQAPVKEQRL